jgi:hypothetical protein
MANLWKPLRRALLPMAVLGFAACQGEVGPVNPEAVTPSFVEVNGVKLVTVRPGRSLAPADGASTQRVQKNDGATLSTGDAVLTIVPGSMSRTATVTMEPQNDSGYVQFLFGPSGLGFSPAATLRISAAKANIDPSQLSRLRIAGASDGADDWQIVGGVYDPVTNTVTAPILHFSRYALCVE